MAEAGAWGRWAVVAAVLSVAAACGPSDYVFTLPPDVVPNGTVVMAVRSASGLQLFARAGSDRPLLSIDLPSDEPFELVALVYPQSLQALELPSGMLTQTPASECGARALPAAPAQYVLGSDQARWQLLAAPPDDLLSIRIPGGCPCASFEIDGEVLLPEMPDAFWVQDDALHFFGAGRVHHLTAQGALSSTDLSSGPGQTWAAVVDPNGEVWTVTKDELWSGRPEVGFVRTATVQAQGGLRDVDGNIGEAGWQLYGVTEQGDIVDFGAGVSAEVISSRPDGPANSQQAARISTPEPGLVVASEAGTLNLTILQQGLLPRREVFPAESRGAHVLQAVPGVGLMALTVLSTAYVLEQGRFELIDGAPQVATPNRAALFGDGIIYVGDSGYVQQYVPDHGFCETSILAGRPRLSGIVVLSEAAVAWGPSPSGPKAYIISSQ